MSTKEIKFLLGVTALSCCAAILCVGADEAQPKQFSHCQPIPGIPKNWANCATLQPCKTCNDHEGHCHVDKPRPRLSKILSYLKPKHSLNSKEQSGGEDQFKYPLAMTKIDLPPEHAPCVRRSDDRHDDEAEPSRMSTTLFGLNQLRNLGYHVMNRKIPIVKLKKGNLLDLVMPAKLAKSEDDSCHDDEADEKLLRMSTTQFALEQLKELRNHVLNRKLPLLKMKKDNLLGLTKPQKLDKAGDSEEDSCYDNSVSKY